MPRTKSRPSKTSPKKHAASNGKTKTPDVLTLDEAAAYLRVPADAVLRMIDDEKLPGRRFGEDWRFSRAAVQAWLAAPPAKRGILPHLGALKDDPYLEEMLRDIYARRGRPETEEG